MMGLGSRADGRQARPPLRVIIRVMADSKCAFWARALTAATNRAYTAFSWDRIVFRVAGACA